jgi:two-component system NarL family response regulator
MLHERTLHMTLTHDGQHTTLAADAPASMRRVTDQDYAVRRMGERVREVGGTLELCEAARGPIIQVAIPLRREGDLRAPAVQFVLASHQPETIQTLRAIMNLYGLRVIGTAQGSQELSAQAHALDSDIVLLDAALPPHGATHIVRQLRVQHPDIKTVVFTNDATDEELLEVIRSGAVGYLPLSLPPSDLVALLLGLQRGEMALLPTMAKKVLETFTEHDQPATETARPQTAPDYLSSMLSPRQMEVLWLVAQDYTYREVGEILGFSERTIKHYMSHIIKQLHLQNRAEAIALVRQRMNQTALGDE